MEVSYILEELYEAKDVEMALDCLPMLKDEDELKKDKKRTKA